MFDQANQLRRLVRQCAGVETAASTQRPGIVVVTSGKGGVGTTTVAVHLAVTLAQRGRRTALVDADPRGGNVALLCGLQEQSALADVLAAKRTAVEALQPGPGGILVLSGGWCLQRPHDYPPAAGQRLLGQLENLGATADLVVVDVGNGQSGIKRRFWQAADARLLVTTPDTAAILDTYASIKGLAGADKSRSICIVVNLAARTATAENVHARLGQACRRFLGLTPVAAGRIPPEREFAAVPRAAAPFVLTDPHSKAAQHFDALAKAVSQAVAKAKLHSTSPEGPRGDQVPDAAVPDPGLEILDPVVPTEFS